MTNTELLNEYIDRAGVKRNHLARALGLSPYGLARKIRNESEFKVSEIRKLQSILNINTHAELMAVFFVDAVDLKSTTNKRLYNLWLQMLYRCDNPKHISYKYYGGRGITVCEEWRQSFEAFHDWALANGYSDSLTIDRIEPDGDYEPSNCRWATMKEQCHNRRPRNA
jgi:hypothetical protein